MMFRVFGFDDGDGVSFETERLRIEFGDMEGAPARSRRGIGGDIQDDVDATVLGGPKDIGPTAGGIDVAAVVVDERPGRAHVRPPSSERETSFTDVKPGWSWLGRTLP